MDCQLPVMNGPEATRRIREKEAKMGGYTPIVAMTAKVIKRGFDCSIIRIKESVVV